MEEGKIREILNLVKWDENGLVLFETLKTKKAHYYSRSRRKIWLKGEESGHIQLVKDLYVDCDNDTLLLLVEQIVAACHSGYYSCFYRRMKEDGLEIVGKKIFDEREVYKKGR